MAGYKMFKHTDGNAPVLSVAAGSVINLLRKVLIDGYGDKTPVPGWTLEFINDQETVAVFRNSPTLGTGAFLRVDETSNTYVYRVDVMGYELMTDLNNGSGVFGSSNYFTKSISTSTTSRPWWMFVSDTDFHLICVVDKSVTDVLSETVVHTMSMLNFGDYLPFKTEAFPAYLDVTFNSGNNYFGFLASNASYFKASTSRNVYQTPNTEAALNHFHMGPVFASSLYYRGPTFAGELLLAEIGVYDNAIDQSAYRGIIPGIYLPCHDPISLTWGQEIVDGVTTYVLFPHRFYSSYYKAIAFEFGEV